jgi:hypothetical protein
MLEERLGDWCKAKVNKKGGEQGGRMKNGKEERKNSR